ncbi:hypothetical protein AB0919_26125 [Streptomyces sp. NPDC046994]|uniref:hypothetical protein n=1 Tax=Streptomyces sp. NPDC046994 TaxID=3155735 RepID=UPI003454889E
MALPNTVKILRILLYILMGFVAIAVVGITLQQYPGSVFMQVLSLLPAMASCVQVFYLQPGRSAVRITLTVTLTVYTFGALYGLVMEQSPGDVVGLVLGIPMLVLLHQRSSREWFAQAASETAGPPSRQAAN